MCDVQVVLASREAIVDGMKKDLAAWRAKLDARVNEYESELGGLRVCVENEAKSLRKDFQDLRRSLFAPTSTALAAGTC